MPDFHPEFKEQLDKLCQSDEDKSIKIALFTVTENDPKPWEGLIVKIARNTGFSRARIRQWFKMVRENTGIPR